MENKEYLDKAKDILQTKTPRMNREQLCSFVDKFIVDCQRYISAYDNGGSPLYLFDEQALTRKAKEFKEAFNSHFSKVRIFYALKSNSHPFLLERLVKEGYGIDVSSGNELEQALRQTPEKIIFSGPGKTLDELELACNHTDIVTVLLDSFGELYRLEEIAERKKVQIKAGVRVMVEEKGLWRKFGILLSEVEKFFDEAEKCPNIELCGLQFHSSWNLDDSKQTSFICRLGDTLGQIKNSVLQKIKFIDIGGGYWPVQGEWMQPSATPEGRLKECINPRLSQDMEHYCIPSMPIDEFATRLSKSLKNHVLKYTDCTIFLEPGRWISHESMHILVKVVDKKSEDIIITDGGTNMIGWERYETDYFPVINLTRPSLQEKPCMIFGSLCTPHDLWGYSYFGEDIKPGDILLIPTQGAYTYSLRQEFIKPIPDVYRLQ